MKPLTFKNYVTSKWKRLTILIVLYTILLTVFFENDDFVKIVLPLRWVGPSKNRSGERLRTATAQENATNRFRRRLRTHFFAPGPVFCRFWAPGRTRKLPKNRPPPRSPVVFLWPEIDFLCFLRPSAFRKPPGSILEAPGTLPDQILIGFSRFYC